jgi:hypothetical protein
VARSGSAKNVAERLPADEATHPLRPSLTTPPQLTCCTASARPTYARLYDTRTRLPPPFPGCRELREALAAQVRQLPGYNPTATAEQADVKATTAFLQQAFSLWMRGAHMSAAWLG